MLQHKETTGKVYRCERSKGNQEDFTEKWLLQKHYKVGMDYKKYIIKKGEEELGITFYDIEHFLLTPELARKFDKFISGQTAGFIDESCTTGVCYVCDFEKFLRLNNLLS